MNPLDLIRALLGGGQPSGSSGGRGGTPGLPMPLQPMQGAEPDRTWGELASFLDLLDDPGIAATRQLSGGDTRGGYEAIWQAAQTAFQEGGAYESPYADAGIGERLLGGVVVPGGGAADMIQGISSGVRAIPAILSGAGDALGAIRSGDNVMEVLSELVRRPATRRDPGGGFSYDPRTGEMVAADGGFTVAGYADEASLDTRLIGPEVIDAYRATNEQVLQEPGNLLGGWLNAEEGRGYLDVSRVIGSQEEALVLARDMQQLAIFDIANRESISTGIRRGVLDPVEAAAYEVVNLPATVTGHPRFDVIRRDVSTLAALGFDPAQWERAGSGMVLPRPQTRVSQATYDGLRETIEANRATTIQMFEAGRARGAVRWYDNQEILDLSIEAMDGDATLGRTVFDMLMEIEGVASAGSTVPQQTQRASWLWYQLANGVPPGEIGLRDLPRGMGNMSWTEAQQKPFRRFDAGASPFSDDALKTGNYTGNLQGQRAPFTADRWMPRMMTNDLANRTSPPPSGVAYTAFADAATEMARELGVSPRDFQAAVWVGAGTVMNPDSFRQVFLNGIYRAATERGVTPAQAMRQFYNGDIHVTHIMGHDTTDDLRRRAARMLAQATPAQEEDETGESNMRLLEMLQGGF